MAKPRPLVKPAGRLEPRLHPRLQAQATIPTPARFLEDVMKHRGRDTFAQMPRHRPHRLDLAVVCVQFLERAATEQFAILPDTPERHLRSAQSLDRQRMHTLRG